MGDIIWHTKVKTIPAEQGRELELLFDSGSPFTFVRRDKALELGNIFNLPAPAEFNALGNGKFRCKSIIYIYVKLADIWCKWIAHVAEKKDIDAEILVGHDFMQVYDIRLDLKQRKILVEREALLRAQKVR